MFWQQLIARLLQGVLKSVVKFMLNLEHLAVLLALLNSKKAGQNVKWRKKQYGRVMLLLDQQLVEYEHFVKQLDQVMSKMWKNLPAVQQLGATRKEQLDQGSALQQLDVMHLYVDSKADETRENLAECKACKSQDVSDAEAEAAAEAEAEAAYAAVDDNTADVDNEDDEQTQDDGVAAGRSTTAQASRATGASGRRLN